MSEYDDLMAEVAAFEVEVFPKAALKDRAKELLERVDVEYRSCRTKLKELDARGAALRGLIEANTLKGDSGWLEDPQWRVT